MNEELDSQLSAMFDDELPAAECELLARRLSRDEQLKARWGRYAVIGATIRAERGVRLNAGLARRVSAAISSEPVLAAEPVAQPKKKWANRWWQPVASAAAVAGVAAVSILWMRSQSPEPTAAMAQTSRRRCRLRSRRSAVPLRATWSTASRTVMSCRRTPRAAWWCRAPS